MKTIPKNTSLMQFEQMIHSIFHRAFLFRSSSIELRTILDDEIYLPMGYKSPAGKARFNNHLKGYVNGLIAAHRELMWQHLEFVYILDGEWYSTAKESAHKLVDELFASNNGHKLSTIVGQFYWKGSTKLFF